jgi:hypothetical protein
LLGLILSALPIRPLNDPPPSLGLCLEKGPHLRKKWQEIVNRLGKETKS